MKHVRVFLAAIIGILLCAPVFADEYYKEYFEIMLSKAEAGDKKAQVEVGYLYKEGYGALKNEAKAEEWVRKGLTKDKGAKFPFDGVDIIARTRGEQFLDVWDKTPKGPFLKAGPIFADVPWESSVERVKSILGKKGYVFESEGSAVISELEFSKEFFGHKAQITFEFFDEALCGVTMKFPALESHNSWGVTQKIKKVLSSKYGQPTTVDHYSNYPKRKRDITEDEFKKVINDSEPDKYVSAEMGVRWIIGKNELWTETPLSLTLDWQGLRVFYKSPQSIKTHRERGLAWKAEERKEVVEKARREAKATEDF